MRRAAWSLAVATALSLAACSQSSAERTATPTTTVPPPPSTALELPQLPRFTLGDSDIQAVDTPAELPANVRTEVQSLLDRYLNNTLVIPLRSGEPVGDVSGLFAVPALDRLSGPDRAALFDEGLPKPEKVHVDEATANLTALVGPDGVAVLAAAIRIVVTATIDGGTLSIERTGELQLSSEGNGWKVSGYDISATRIGPGGVVTSTTVP
jgi:hypothetical protein